VKKNRQILKGQNSDSGPTHLQRRR
jgi:hypothetical protein